MADLAAAVDEVLLGLGEDITKVETRTYRAYKRMGNFACLCPPRQDKLLLYLKLDPKSVDLVPGSRGMYHDRTSRDWRPGSPPAHGPGLGAR